MNVKKNGLKSIGFNILNSLNISLFIFKFLIDLLILYYFNVAYFFLVIIENLMNSIDTIIN
jgi:hypothetical protein